MAQDQIPRHDLHDDPSLSPAWAPWFSHEYITYYSIHAVDSVMALPAVAVAGPPAVGVKWALGPNHADVYKEQYVLRHRLDPMQTFDYAARNGDFATEPPPDKRIEPWKILVIYCTEPDLNPDCGLNLDKNQKITGGSHGWRHMQFRIFGKTYGTAVESVHMHVRLAVDAFAKGNAYWGWRYLSRCGHYLADLGNPFHVKALPLSFLIRKLFAPEEIFMTVSAIHQSYEVFVEQRFRQGYPAFKKALSQGSSEGKSSNRNYASEIKNYVAEAEAKFNSIFHFFYDQFGRGLIDVFKNLDPDSEVDAAVQIKDCSAGAANIIFAGRGAGKLEFLDRITSDILFDVGRMLGMLYSGFKK